MRYSILSILLFPLFAFSQPSAQDVFQEYGIRFQEGQTWAQVIEKARKENKYVFVDCYATWCNPCKRMEQVTFKDKETSEFYNDRYLSVRLQFDTSDNDSDEIIARRDLAKEFLLKYNVNTFPTFLYFTENGEIVNKAVGFRSAKPFLQLGKEVFEGTNQFYSKLNLYRTGVMPYKEYVDFCSFAANIKEDSLAKDVFYKFMAGYVNIASSLRSLTRTEVEFISNNRSLVKETDQFFQWVLNEPLVADSICGDPHFSRTFIAGFIIKRIIMPEVEWAKNLKREPDWEGIKQAITLNYGQKNVNYPVVQSKISWYKNTGDMAMASRFIVEKMAIEEWRKSKPDVGALVYLNNTAFFVFENSDNKRELESALEWIDKALDISIRMDNKPSPGVLDTKANLLYKLGRVKEAISLQSEVVKLIPEEPEFNETLIKMKKGIATWSTGTK